MDKFVDIVNNDFQELFYSNRDPRYHLFFDSFIHMSKNFENWAKSDEKSDDSNIIKKVDPDQKKYNFNNSIDLTDIKSVDRCSYKPKKTLSKKKLDELYSIITDPDIHDFETIRKHLEIMFDYNLPSTIDTIDDFIKSCKQSVINTPNYNLINIVIVGAGPIGLYTALYLKQHYNYNSVFSIKTGVNVILLDNRIYKEGIKLPYSRVTQFGFDRDQIHLFINNIYCWKHHSDVYDKNRMFDFVNMLENLLFLVAFKKGISMYFTKKYETFDKLKTFATNNNIHYIFDCTGGRLDVKLKDNVPNILWNRFSFKKDNMEVRYTGNNKYEFFVDNVKYEHITIVLKLYDKNQKPFSIGNMFGFVTDNDDKVVLEKYKNICYTIDDYLKIIRHFKSINLRYLLFSICDASTISMDKIKYVKITTFNSNSHHVNRASQKLTNSLVYVGLGNTLGYSEYGIFFGLKTGINFAKHVCNLLSTVKYLDK